MTLTVRAVERTPKMLLIGTLLLALFGSESVCQTMLVQTPDLHVLCGTRECPVSYNCITFVDTVTLTSITSYVTTEPVCIYEGGGGGGSPPPPPGGGSCCKGNPCPHGGFCDRGAEACIYIII
jgi:hypothetical protein